MIINAATPFFDTLDAGNTLSITGVSSTVIVSVIVGGNIIATKTIISDSTIGPYNKDVDIKAAIASGTANVVENIFITTEQAVANLNFNHPHRCLITFLNKLWSYQATKVAFFGDSTAERLFTVAVTAGLIVLSNPGTGAFFTDVTRGIEFQEGDLFTAVVNAGFTGGTLPKLKMFK